jgi:signal transduction histidine kinase
MRLTRKFIAALVIGVALVALRRGYLDYQRARVAREPVRGEAAALGRCRRARVADVWQRDGEAARGSSSRSPRRRRAMQARWVGSTRKGPTSLARRARARADDPGSNRRGARRRGATSTRTFASVLSHDSAGSRSRRSEQLDAYLNVSLRTRAQLGQRGRDRGARAQARRRCSSAVRSRGSRRRRGGWQTGDLSGPLHLRQRDELGELAAEINLMCERLAEERAAREQATEQLRHADRLTTVGKLASGLAHELGTPLNVVRGRAKLILDHEVEGDEVANSARIVVEQAERMTALIRELLDFARPRAPKKSPVNAPKLARRVCELSV